MGKIKLAAYLQQGNQDYTMRKGVLFNNWCWETGHPQAKEGSWALTLHHTQKLTQTGLKTET